VISSTDSTDSAKVFICYKEENGSLYAELIHLILSKVDVNSFVAHLQRNKHSMNFNKMRREVLKVVKFFIFINTEGALLSKEIKKEFKMAYPTGDTSSPFLIILHHKNGNRRPTPNDFKSKLGVTVRKSKNIASFRDKDDLIETACELPKFHNISSKKLNKNLIKNELRLVKYLEYCFRLRENTSGLDNRTLSELYVPNDCVFTKIANWNIDDYLIPTTNNNKWTVPEFLSGDNKIAVIGSEYGVGKTYFSYNLASELASKALKNFSTEIIPVHIPMKYGSHRIDDKGNNLTYICSLIPKDRRVLFILDGLDEYSGPEKLQQIYRKLLDKFSTYRQSKVIVTSRLNSNYPQLLEADWFVKMKPFTTAQINEFFQKYKISLTFEKLLGSGIESGEISKPLFCHMLSVLYKEKGIIKLTKNPSLNRTIIFLEFIHSIVLGKPAEVANQYGYSQHYIAEKKVLRKIAELKHIYGENLTVDRIHESLKTTKDRVKKQFFPAFQKLVSSYFYITEQYDYDERIEFIHKSFVEYLLAEFYVGCFLIGEPYVANVKLPTRETIQFLSGLLELIKKNGRAVSKYQELLSKSFRADMTRNRMKQTLIDTAKRFFNDEDIHLVNKQNYPDIVEPYENIGSHRWMSIFIINILGKGSKLDKEKFYRLLRATHSSIPPHLITLNNIDLSRSKITSGLSNCNLVNANLKKSRFQGTFYGTSFSGANLSYSKIIPGTRFISVDFSGANLSNIGVDYPSEHSPFLAHFIDCDFSKCKMNNAVLKETSFRLSNFSGADISGANLHYADISLTNMADIILDEKTDTDSINLLSKGYEFEWESIRNNKELIRTILDDFDPHFDRKMKEKILSDNPEY
jgi:uncharacterized protein YjbI with pentapeptide repeats